MGLRDRGLRLAGYLTPPSDVTQEEDDNAERYVLRLWCVMSFDYRFNLDYLFLPILLLFTVEWCRHSRKSNRAKFGHRQQ